MDFGGSRVRGIILSSKEGNVVFGPIYWPLAVLLVLTSYFRAVWSGLCAKIQEVNFKDPNFKQVIFQIQIRQRPDPGPQQWWYVNILFQDYSTDGMSQGLLIFLQHLREFGLVYQRKVGPWIVFYNHLIKFFSIFVPPCSIFFLFWHPPPSPPAHI